ARTGISINASTTFAGYEKYYLGPLLETPRSRRFFVGNSPSGKLSHVPDLSGELPPLSDREEHKARQLSQIANAGGSISIGGHGDYDGIGFHLEMWAHVRGGMTAHEVLRAGTLGGAW